MATAGSGIEATAASMHARRLDALWKISTAELRDEDMTRALLTLAAAQMRPGMPFAAHIHRVAGNELIVEETVSRDPGDGPLPARGSATALVDSPLLEVVQRRSSHAAPDLRAVPELAGRALVRERRMRSFVGAAFRAGANIFTVSVTSTQALDGTFDADDAHFLETIASLLETLIERRLQRARIHARAGNDALTHR